MNDIAPNPTVTAAKSLMSASMPPFEKFLEHATALKGECEKAGALTPERAANFDAYTAALLADRDEYENRVAATICEHFTAEEVDLLIAFYASPAHKAVEKALGLGPIINNLGTQWQTETLERCPDAWQMLMNDAGTWQAKNSPEGSEVIVADVPPSASAWKKVDLSPGGAKVAEEFVPSAPTEEAELERLRSVD